MCHELPAMLSNRVFPVLVVTAKRGKHAFVVVQIPVEISGLTVAMYSNGRNLHEGDSPVKRKKPVLGYERRPHAQTLAQTLTSLAVSIQALSTAGCCRTKTLSG